jgi:hypothetical protein
MALLGTVRRATQLRLRLVVNQLCSMDKDDGPTLINTDAQRPNPISCATRCWRLSLAQLAFSGHPVGLRYTRYVSGEEPVGYSYSFSRH